MDLAAGHLDHIELILKRIDGEQVIIHQGPGRNRPIVSERSGKGNLCGGAAQAQGVDQVEVVAHAGIAVTGAQFGLQLSYFLEGEGLDGFVIGMELLFHHRIHLAFIYRNQIGLGLAGDNFSTLHGQADVSVTHEAAMAAGVDEGRVPPGDDIGMVIVRADKEINPFQRMQQVHSLALQRCFALAARSRMDGYDDDLRLLLGPDGIHRLLDTRNKGFEGDAAPDAFGQPVLHIRVGEAEDGNLQPVAFQDCIFREIRASVAVFAGIPCQEGDSGGLHFAGDAVIDRMSRFNVVVAYRDGIVPHVGGHPRVHVRLRGIHVVEIVGGIVPLEDVTGIDQNDVFLTRGRTYAIHAPCYGHQRFAGFGRRVGGIEIGSVYVVGGEQLEGVFTIFWPAGANERQGGNEHFLHQMAALKRYVVTFLAGFLLRIRSREKIRETTS